MNNKLLVEIQKISPTFKEYFDAKRIVEKNMSLNQNMIRSITLS